MAPKGDPKSAAKKKAPPKKEEDGEAADDSKRIEAPDKTAFEAASNEIKEKVDGLQKKLKDLSSKIGERSFGKDEFYQNKAKIRDQIMSESDAIGELQARKQEIIKTMQQNNADAKQSNMELKTMKKKLGWSDSAQIDDRIASIEFKLWTESITLKEEKKLLEEIKQLKRDKPKVAKVHEKEAEVEMSKGNVELEGKSMKEALDLISAEMATHRERKNDLSAELKKLVDERQAQMGDMPTLFEERDKLNQEIRDEIKKRDALREEHKKKEKEYYELQRELREARQEKARAEREQRNKEWEDVKKQKRVEKLDEQPHQQEITLLEQTIKFCKSFQPKEDAKAEEKKETSHDNKPEGAVVLVGKANRDEEFYYAPTKKSKANKAKGKQGGTSGSKSIKHNAETFKLFANLKVDAPVTEADIPATLEKLEAEMEKYKDKIKQWEQDREEKKRKILAGEDEEEEEKAEKAEKAEPTEDKKEDAPEAED